MTATSGVIGNVGVDTNVYLHAEIDFSVGANFVERANYIAHHLERFASQARNDL